MVKNKTFFDSVKCALRGLFYALRSEKNFKSYFFIILTFLALNIIFKVNILSYMFMLLSACGVFSSECLNTSIEHFINYVDGEIKEEIRIIKDVAAGGVVVWAFAFFGSQIFFIVMSLFGVL